MLSGWTVFCLCHAINGGFNCMFFENTLGIFYSFVPKLLNIVSIIMTKIKQCANFVLPEGLGLKIPVKTWKKLKRHNNGRRLFVN